MCRASCCIIIYALAHLMSRSRFADPVDAAHLHIFLIAARIPLNGTPLFAHVLCMHAILHIWLAYEFHTRVPCYRFGCVGIWVAVFVRLAYGSNYMPTRLPPDLRVQPYLLINGACAWDWANLLTFCVSVRRRRSLKICISRILVTRTGLQFFRRPPALKSAKPFPVS